jgi:crossover junction endodeoxyribonuclease RuvC
MIRPLKVIALDLSLTGTGIAATHTRKGEPRLWCTTVAPRRQPSATAIDHGRLHAIITQITLLAQMGPDLVVIERPLQRPGQGETSIRLAELHGAVKHWLWCRGIKYVDINLTKVKTYACGNGGAKKDEVQAAVTATYGRLLHIGTDDEADAMSLLAMALDAHGQPLAEVPESHRRALTGITWPQIKAVS